MIRCARGSMVALIAAAGGCSLLEPRPDSELDAVRAELRAVYSTVATNERGIVEITENQAATLSGLDSQSREVAALAEQMERLPKALAALCPRPASNEPPECTAVTQFQQVKLLGEVILLGAMEHVWIEPPGISLHARIDTGAARNSLNAEGLVEFERDGNDWVRFLLRPAGGADEARIRVERRIARYVRVFQQADKEGTRRPVIKLGVRLGNVRDTFEFTLADRSHLDHQVMLGRNFLIDIAVVDVGKRFVQPPYAPPESNTN